MTNPFLEGINPLVLAQTLEPGQSVRIRYHSYGIGLGGDRHDHDVTGEFVEDDGFNVVVNDQNGDVFHCAPHFWLDSLEVL